MHLLALAIHMKNEEGQAFLDEIANRIKELSSSERFDLLKRNSGCKPGTSKRRGTSQSAMPKKRTMEIEYNT